MESNEDVQDVDDANRLWFIPTSPQTSMADSRYDTDSMPTLSPRYAAGIYGNESEEAIESPSPANYAGRFGNESEEEIESPNPANYAGRFGNASEEAIESPSPANYAGRFQNESEEAIESPSPQNYHDDGEACGLNSQTGYCPQDSYRGPIHNPNHDLGNPSFGAPYQPPLYPIFGATDNFARQPRRQIPFNAPAFYSGMRMPNVCDQPAPLPNMPRGFRGPLVEPVRNAGENTGFNTRQGSSNGFPVAINIRNAFGGPLNVINQVPASTGRPSVGMHCGQRSNYGAPVAGDRWNRSGGSMPAGNPVPVFSGHSDVGRDCDHRSNDGVPVGIDRWNQSGGPMPAGNPVPVFSGHSGVGIDCNQRSNEEAPVGIDRWNRAGAPMAAGNPGVGIDCSQRSNDSAPVAKDPRNWSGGPKPAGNPVSNGFPGVGIDCNQRSNYGAPDLDSRNWSGGPMPTGNPVPVFRGPPGVGKDCQRSNYSAPVAINAQNWPGVPLAANTAWLSRINRARLNLANFQKDGAREGKKGHRKPPRTAGAKAKKRKKDKKQFPKPLSRKTSATKGTASKSANEALKHGSAQQRPGDKKTDTTGAEALAAPEEDKEVTQEDIDRAVDQALKCFSNWLERPVPFETAMKMYGSQNPALDADELRERTRILMKIVKPKVVMIDGLRHYYCS